MDSGTTVTQIGKYQVLGVLGAGGMGVVYRGMDKSVGREVAIKTLTEATDELRQRFLLEARSGVLNHPNIVTVYDFGEQDGNPYIVMEFVKGDSLENLLRGGRTFTLIEKLEIVRQVCLALGYAHQHGVVHRDIKPANVMVQPDGNIKIVDFGVARLESQSGHTQTGMVIGTFHYISPERLLGKPADGRADLWSAGVILYQLLTGRLPFPGDDPATLHRVIREPHEPVTSIRSDYPQSLNHLIDHALAKDPLDRYETGEEMAADIEAINDDLKREHVDEALGNVKQMMEREQWTNIRPILLDLQRLNPQNTEVKRLLREVQDKISRQQKTMQLQQLLGEAEEAVLAQRYKEALDLYNQAAAIDRGNTELTQKIEHVRGLKEKAEKVASLLEQSREARRRSDFATAGELIERALQLDERNTDLRNERARIVQEAERSAKERTRREYSEAAKGQLAARQYTEAIKNLRAALEIDPTDSETQQLYQSALERQEEQRRRKIIDQIVAEISECITAQEYERALTLIQRAQERLPGEAVLLQLKAEAETKQREQSVKKLVDETSLRAYDLLSTDPQQALTVVHKALEQAPGDTRLIALESKVAEQVKKATTGERKAQYVKQAQAAIDAKQFDQAVQILEAATIEYADSPELASLLTFALEQKRKIEVGQAVANATRESQTLMAAGNFETAVTLLQRVAAETGDASIEQQLNQANASLAELNRRVDAVVTRAQSMGESNIEQALQLLSSQPQEIQRQPRVRELKAKLDAGNERDRAIGTAIRDAAEALKNRDLRSGLTELESLQKTYRDSTRLSSAIAEHKTERAKIANEMLTSAIESATQAIQQGDRPRAAEAINRAGDAIEFAEAGLQASLKRLAKEAGTAPPKPQVAAQPVKSKSNGLLITVIVMLVIGAAAAGYWYLYLRPAPAPAVGALELNATPYAEVVGVTSDKGKAIALPAGDHWTPLRIDQLSPGSYTVELKGTDGTTQKQQCDVAQTEQVCNIELKQIDDQTIEQIIGGAK